MKKLAVAATVSVLLFLVLVVGSACSPASRPGPETDHRPASRSPSPQAAASWPGPHPAPQLVMTPINSLLNLEQVPELVAKFIERTGFHGFHIPLQGDRPGSGTLELLRLADERGFWVHLWMYGDQQGGTAPERLDQDAQHTRQVAHDLAPFSNWSMGLGYDLQEWADAQDVRQWIERVEAVAPGHVLGGRVVPEEEALPGGYAGWEHKVIDKARLEDELRAAIERSGSRPLMSEDRFRVRAETRDKDWTPEQVTAGIATTLQLNVAAIWGFRLDGPVSDLGSAPWPNAEALRAELRPRRGTEG